MPVLQDDVFRAVAYRRDRQRQRLAAIGMQWPAWVMTGGDQLTAQREHRCFGAHSDAERSAAVIAGQFGADRIGARIAL